MALLDSATQHAFQLLPYLCTRKACKDPYEVPNKVSDDKETAGLGRETDGRSKLVYTSATLLDNFKDLQTGTEGTRQDMSRNTKRFDIGIVDSTPTSFP